MTYTKTKLKNGLNVITVPMRDNPTVTVLVLVATGSKYETKEISGLSHFLEHMCFKGTTRRPTAQAIASELDALGCQYNAFTGQEYTGYYAKADAKHFEKVFDVISDIYLNSTFPEAEIEKEKGVIVEEINMYEDMPQRQVQDLFMTLLYGDQPAGWNIAGTREIVRSFNRSQFVAYKNAHYVPKATTVVIAGKVSQKSVEKKVQTVFGVLPSTKKHTKPKVVEKQTKPALMTKQKATDQTHLVLGVRTVDLFHKANPSLDVLATILGGGMSSRLFLKLREELGVAYYVRAANATFTDHGFFEIRAGVSNDRFEEVVREILTECVRMTRELVPESELEKAKEYIVGNVKLELESSDAWASYFGGQEVLGRKIETIEDYEKKIRKVTAKDIQKIAKEIFVDARLNLAFVGPNTDTTSLLKKITFNLK